MTQATINFHQRIALWLRIGTVQVPSLKEAATLIRIIDKIRPKDDEMQDTKYTQKDGRIEYVLPDPSYGMKSYEFENEETKKMVEALHNQTQPFSVNEASWILALIEDLENQMKSEIKDGDIVSK